MKKISPEYMAWKAMKSRCYTKNRTDGNYKSNGITVCDEWRNDFKKFYADMGNRPSALHALDRIDNLKGYSKENCRWATRDVQAKNRGSFNKVFSYQGETKILKDWARHFGIKYTTLYMRLHRSMMSFEDAVGIKSF